MFSCGGFLWFLWFLGGSWQCLVGVWSIWVEVGCSGWVAGWWSSESLGWVWLWRVVVGSDQVEVKIGVEVLC